MAINQKIIFLVEICNIIINKQIPSSELQSFNLTFDVLYFNSSVRQYSSFPHKVALLGLKKNNRNLEEIKYNYRINFTNCITGAYSKEEENVIGSIRCLFPDFVPAGTYSKLESDGFDVNPNCKINVVFEENFNRNPSNETYLDYQILKSSSSSSSKTWIIWLVAGLLLLILIIIVIIACVCNKKESGESVDNSKYNEESNNSNNNMQNSNHSESN